LGGVVGKAWANAPVGASLVRERLVCWIHAAHRQLGQR
jgi:hypothetical protein